MDEKYKKKEEEIKKEVEKIFAEAALQEKNAAVVKSLSIPNNMHEMKNLISIVMQSAHILSYKLKPGDEFFKSLKDIMDSAAKMVKIVQKISNSYLSFSINRENVDLNEIINSSQPVILEGKHEKIQIKFNLNDGPLVIHADIAQIKEMLLCFLTNIQALIMPNGGILEITTCPKVHKKDYLKWADSNILPIEQVLLSLSISNTKNVANFKESLFSTMFSPSQEEDKVKLSNALKTLHKHDGDIDIIELDKGVKVNIYIPTINHKNPKDLLPKL